MTDTADRPAEGSADEPVDPAHAGPGPDGEAPDGPAPAAPDADGEHELLATPDVEKEDYPWWDLRRITGGGPTRPLMVLFGLNAVDELDREAFNVLIPNIRDAFGLSTQGVLTLSALVALAVLLLEVPLSHLADRMNRIRISVAGAAAWSGFSVFTGLANSVPFLAVARSGAGLGRAVNGSTHNSLLSDWYPPSVRPAVFGVHRAANSVGMFAGPLLAGGLAYHFGWRAPFLIFAVPTIFFIFMAARLKEPVRGGQERSVLGGDEAAVATEEKAATISEAFRVLWAVKSMRRIWLALPLVAIAVVGLTPLIQLYYEEAFGLDEMQRGIVSALAEPAQIVGYIVGIPIATRLMRRDPSLLVKFLAILTALSALSLLFLVASHNLPLAVGSQVVMAGVRSCLGPGLFALFSLVIPPRVRSLGFSVGNFFIIPALAAAPIVGGFADSWGLRPAIMLLIPVLLAGAWMLGTAAPFVPGDMDRSLRGNLAIAEARKARLDGDPKLLLVRNLDVYYGQTQVLFDVDFEVRDGEIVALLGTNGAGKSTLLKSISGLAPSDRGVVILDGRDITSADAVQNARLGLTQVPGEKGIFPTLTVAEHIGLAGWTRRHDPDGVSAATEEALSHFPALRDRWDLPAGALSGGEQQMLSLAQAFISQPRLLMIDELTMGLAPTVVEQLVAIIPAIQANGTSIVLVEQSVHTALRLAERAVFMEKGEVRFTGSTSDLIERRDLLRSLFLEGASRRGVGGGGGVEDPANGAGPAGTPDTAGPAGPAGRSEGAASVQAAPEGEPVGAAGAIGPDVALEVVDLTKRYGGVSAVSSVSFQLRDGEILGLIGPNGAGKTTLFDLISGFQRLDGGRVHLWGRDITDRPAHARARAGLGRSFQNAQLWPSLTVREAVATACEHRVEVGAALPAFLHLPMVADSEELVMGHAEELLELLNLARHGDKFVAELSTGMRRMVDLAVQLAAEPSVLLLDEPSSGIAQRETEALGPILRDVQRHLGCSILIIEHDMPLITGLADRLVALETGRLVTTGPPEEVLRDPRVVEAYLGRTDD